MKHSTLLGATLCAVAFAAATPAQERAVEVKTPQKQDKPKQDKPKKKPAQRMAPPRAMRLTAVGQRKPLTQEQLKQKFAEKLDSAFVSNAAWITDYDAARAKAKESDKPIFAYFTRSYAP